MTSRRIDSGGARDGRPDGNGRFGGPRVAALAAFGMATLLVIVWPAVALYSTAGQDRSFTGSGPDGSARSDPGMNLITHSYRLVENWPRLDDGMKWGAAINLIPDGDGGTWALLRTEPPIVHFNRSGRIVASFGTGLFVQAHGMCRDSDGNIWVGDSGPFDDSRPAPPRGFQVFKFASDGKVLLTLGTAGVSRASARTFVGPTACIALENGDILIADGHWPRPSTAQQDGDRLVRYSRDGRFVRDYGSLGRGPGQFMGPHALALDSKGRLFIADRSNNRIQILDADLAYLDSWKHFGRPSGIAILRDDTMVVSDSESGRLLAGPAESFEGGGPQFRNVGWRQGIWLGSAADGSVKQFIDGTNPEGIGADAAGNVFAGLTNGCDVSGSGGCIQKWIRTR